MTGVCMNNELISYILFTYNQELFVSSAIESALAQTYRPLEIIISDDCSTDSTVDVIKEVLKKKDIDCDVRINVNKVNLGIIKHIEYAVRLARADIVVLAAGDDISYPHRVLTIVDSFSKDRNIKYIHSAVKLMYPTSQDKIVWESPGLNDFKSIFSAAKAQSLAIGATQAFKREILFDFPDINSGVWAEDMILGFRASLVSGVKYIEDPLVLYRNETGISFKKISRRLRHRRNMYVRIQKLSDSLHCSNYKVAIYCVFLIIQSFVKSVTSILR